MADKNPATKTIEFLGKVIDCGLATPDDDEGVAKSEVAVMQLISDLSFDDKTEMIAGLTLISAITEFLFSSIKAASIEEMHTNPLVKARVLDSLRGMSQEEILSNMTRDPANVLFASKFFDLSSRG